MVLRPVTEPADGADKVALIGKAYDGRDKELVSENSACGGQHRHVQFPACWTCLRPQYRQRASGAPRFENGNGRPSPKFTLGRHTAAGGGRNVRAGASPRAVAGGWTLSRGADHMAVRRTSSYVERILVDVSHTTDSVAKGNEGRLAVG